MGLHPQFFHVKPTTGTNTCFKVVGRNRIDQGKVEASWAVYGESLWHRNAVERRRSTV